MLDFFTSVNQNYLSMSPDELKENCLIQHPYDVAIFDDFLEQTIFDQVYEEQSKHIFEFEYIPRDEINIADLTYLPLLNIALNGELFLFLEKILDRTFERRLDQLPQIREFLDNGSKGMGIHNDEQFIGSTVVFLYLNDWKNGDGGEIIVYDKQMNPVHKVKPRQNRLFVIPITNHSFHSVEPIREGYKRRCAYFPLNHYNKR
ncbi:MAG: 2OG-Fe(II) oxygenase [Oligoflexales bacterium]